MTFGSIHTWSRGFGLGIKSLPAVLALAGLACVIAPGPTAQAQMTLAPFTRYVVTTRIAGNAGTTVYRLYAINDAGEVGGTVVRSAGKVWKWLPPSGDVWDGTLGLFPKLVSTSYVNATPAIWTGTSLRELPAFNGNHSTWIEGLTADGHWLAKSSVEPGRFPDVVGDRSVRVPFKQARLLSSQGQYGAVIGPAADNANVLDADRNSAGVLVYENEGEGATDRLPHFVVNGQDRVLQPPGTDTTVDFLGLSDDGAVLLTEWGKGRGAPGEVVINCHLYRQGQYLPVMVTVAETVVETRCNALTRDGTVLGSVTVLNPASTTVDRTALYAWKDGQTTLLTAYVPDYFRNVPAVNVNGLSDVGLVGRKDVGKDGLYRNGVFIDALASAGIVMKSNERGGIVSYNKRGQLLVVVQNDSANTRYYAVLSPR